MCNSMCTIVHVKPVCQVALTASIAVATQDHAARFGRDLRHNCKARKAAHCLRLAPAL